MVSTAKRPSMYRHEEMGALSAVECLGCGEVVEIPGWDVLVEGKRPERILDNPENLLQWIETKEAEHEKCHSFSQDAGKQAQARQDHRIAVIRNTVVRRSQAGR